MSVVFAQSFGIRPWELDLLTYQQFCDFERAAIELSRKK